MWGGTVENRCCGFPFSRARSIKRYVVVWRWGQHELPSHPSETPPTHVHCAKRVRESIHGDPEVRANTM